MTSVNRRTALKMINDQVKQQEAARRYVQQAVMLSRKRRQSAAVELGQASDVVRLLESCERATGRRWVTGQDSARVRIAADAWAVLNRTRRARPTP
jgi:hypothetical protein